MAYSDSPHDEALRKAWHEFCARLQAAGEQVFKEHNPGNPLQRADGFLTQNLGQAFDLALETKDSRYPFIHAFSTPLCKLGGDAADYLYQQAWIDGQSVYRIAGTRGTVRFLNFTVQGPRPERAPGMDTPSLHEPFGDIPEANLFGHQLKTGADGSFELFIGGPRRESNWLPTTPGTRKLFIRQGFDRWDEEPARFRIERVGMDAPRPIPTPQSIIEAVDWAGQFMTGLMRDWPEFPYRNTKASSSPVTANVFPPEDPTGDGGSDLRRGRAAVNMCWRLQPDEALIIEFDDHDGFWSLTNMGAFFNSMDYFYRQVSYTPSRAQADGDGRLRFVVSHDDPGYHNWLDTQGFELGNITYRNMPGTSPTDLRTRLVKRAQLASAMPANAARASPAERVAQLQARFHGILRQRFS
jgi:Protein of unknown function (DUF1214)